MRKRFIKKVGTNVFALAATATNGIISKYYDDYKKSPLMRVLLASYVPAI